MCHSHFPGASKTTKTIQLQSHSGVWLVRIRRSSLRRSHLPLCHGHVLGVMAHITSQPLSLTTAATSAAMMQPLQQIPGRGRKRRLGGEDGMQCLRSSPKRALALGSENCLGTAAAAMAAGEERVLGNPRKRRLDGDQDGSQSSRPACVASAKRSRSVKRRWLCSLRSAALGSACHWLQGHWLGGTPR